MAIEYLKAREFADWVMSNAPPWALTTSRAGLALKQETIGESLQRTVRRWLRDEHSTVSLAVAEDLLDRLGMGLADVPEELFTTNRTARNNNYRWKQGQRHQRNWEANYALAVDHFCEVWGVSPSSIYRYYLKARPDPDGQDRGDEQHSH